MPFAVAQDDRDAVQDLLADRYLQVLLRRPRTGTALERLHGHHVQAGSWTTFLAQLKAQADAGGDKAGAKYTLIGLLQLERGNEVEAIESLKKAEPLSQHDAMVSYYLGKALLALGRIDQATEALERAISRRPTRNDALAIFTTLGRIYQRSGKRDEALSVWVRMEKAFPGDARERRSCADSCGGGVT